VSATETYTRGLRHYLEDELGLPCAFHFERRAGKKTDNAAVRKAIHELKPLIIFGGYNERMYLSESGGQSIYIPASLPGTIIRRHTGTPFMGYSGAAYVLQEVCNALFDALYNVLPLGTELDNVAPTLAQHQLNWSVEAEQELNRLVAQQPVLVRISAAKHMRDTAEQLAREHKENTVVREHVRRAVMAVSANDAINNDLRRIEP